MTSLILGPVGRAVVARGLLAPHEVLSCRRVARDVKERFGLDYDEGMVVLETLFAHRKDLRRRMLEPGGLSELVGIEGLEFTKLSTVAHDRMMEEVRASGQVEAKDFDEALIVQRELAGYGLLKQVGEILVDRGRVDRALLLRASFEEAARPIARPERLPALAFDRIAVYNGFLSEGEAAVARDKQEEVEEKTGLRIPIGRILYDTGHLRLKEVQAILEAQVRIGRLDPARAAVKILKVSDAEHQALLLRLQSEKIVELRDVTRANETSERLLGLGLEIDPVEVLWLEDRIPEDAIRDVLAHQIDLLQRLDPKWPDVFLTLAPSADVLARERPEEVPEVDFLFGQCARIEGVVDADELERATEVFVRCRGELQLSLRLGQVMVELYGGDAARREAFDKVRQEVQELIGYSYPIDSLMLGPLEEDIVRKRIEAAGDSIAEERARARQLSEALSELGIEKGEIELLLLCEALPAGVLGDVIEGRRRRDRRLVGGWRSGQEEDPQQADTRLFERAFSSREARSGWARGHIGALAVRQGLLEPPQIVKALYVQIHARELGIPKPLGQVLVELGHLTEAQVADLVRRQDERIDELRRRVPRREVEAPEDLVGDERLLYVRLLTTGAIEDEAMREALHVRAQLQSLGLEGNLHEVLEKKNLVDVEILDGLLREAERQRIEKTRRLMEARARRAGKALPTDSEIHEAYSVAVSAARDSFHTRTAVSHRNVVGRRVRQRSMRPVFAAVAAVLAIATLSIAAAVIGSLAEEPAAPTVEVETVGRPAALVEGPDAARFEEAMERRGMIERDGRWVAADSPEVPPPPAADLEARRGNLARALRAVGMERVAGQWASPADAERKRAESIESEAGRVRHRGRWVDGTRVASPRAPSAVGREAGATVGPIADLEARLAVDGDRTHIEVRFRSTFPGGTRLVVLVAPDERPTAVLHSAPVTVGPGEIARRIRPVPVALEAARYRIRLVYRPELQMRPHPRHPPGSIEAQTGSTLGSAEEVARTASARLDRLEGLRDRMLAVFELLQVEVVADGRLAAEADRLEGIVRDLEASRRPPATHGQARQALLGAARRLVEILRQRSDGRALDRERIAAVRREFEIGAAALAGS